MLFPEKKRARAAAPAELDAEKAIEIAAKLWLKLYETNPALSRSKPTAKK